jgi:sigma-B regulation protein RsbU (phosphoserine phosphatase)
VLDGDLTHALPAARALAEASVGVTLADVRDSGLPLVYANEAFTRLTGYPQDEVIGRNCRFLQGPDTEPGAVHRIREALSAMRETRVTLRNYRRDGTPFHNELLIAPAHDATGVVTHVVGMQLDVTHTVQEANRLRDERDLLRAEVAELRALREVLTPRDIPVVDGWQISARYIAASALAGDFHLVAPTDDGVTVVAIGDAIGHGADAAQQASFVRASLATFAAYTASPERLLELANASLIERVGMSGSFSTCACLALTPDGTVDVALAGHPTPLRLDTGEPLPVAQRGAPLGVTLDVQPSSTTVPLGPGEGLLLYTDGITEARLAGRADRLGEEGVRGTLAAASGLGPAETIDALTGLTPELAAGTPADDVCLLVLRRCD